MANTLRNARGWLLLLGTLTLGSCQSILGIDSYTDASAGAGGDAVLAAMETPADTGGSTPDTPEAQAGRADSNAGVGGNAGEAGTAAGQGGAYAGEGGAHSGEGGSAGCDHVEPTCLDRKHNGTETDEDCGGDCAACPVGCTCAEDADCLSKVCLNGKCVVCEPASRQCDDVTLQTCTPEGIWEDTLRCSVEHGTPSCSDLLGACEVASCETGWGDCDHAYSTGCETNLFDDETCGATCSERVDCSTLDLTNASSASCESGGCVLACAPGYGDCDPAVSGCETRLDTRSSCGVCGKIERCNSDEICRDQSCVDNLPYAIGETSSDGWTEFEPPANRWYLVKVTAPRDAWLIEFQLTGRSVGGLTRMALWHDAGGQPGVFETQTEISLNVIDGISAYGPQNPQTRLTGGESYWVGVKFTSGAKISKRTSPGNVVRVHPQAFADPPSLLSPFPSGTASEGDFSLSLHLLVRDIQEDL